MEFPPKTAAALNVSAVNVMVARGFTTSVAVGEALAPGNEAVIVTVVTAVTAVVVIVKLAPEAALVRATVPGTLATWLLLEVSVTLPSVAPAERATKPWTDSPPNTEFEVMERASTGASGLTLDPLHPANNISPTSAPAVLNAPERFTTGYY